MGVTGAAAPASGGGSIASGANRVLSPRRFEGPRGRAAGGGEAAVVVHQRPHRRGLTPGWLWGEAGALDVPPQMQSPGRWRAGSAGARCSNCDPGRAN